MLTGKALNTIIGGTYSGEVHPIQAPQNAAPPYIVYTLISLVPNATKSGASSVDFEYYQIDVFSRTYTEAVDYTDTIRGLLDRYAHSTVSGVRLVGVEFLGVEEDYSDVADLYLISSEYKFRIDKEYIAE